MTHSILVNLYHYGFLKISGPDAKKLLQGQLTCDVENITSMQYCLGAHCNPQGRIISLFRLFNIEDNYYLCLPRDMITVAQTALKKYAVFYKVEIVDASEGLFCLGTTNLTINKKDVYSFQIHHSKEPRYLIIGDKNNLENVWNELAQQAQIATFDVWKALEFDAGIADIYLQTTEKILPHEINLHEYGAISFSKGCYTGQEIIARMHYRGKLKKRIYAAHIDNTSIPHPGAEVYCADSANVCGLIIDSCHEKDNNYKVLIMLDDANITKTLTLNPKGASTNFNVSTLR